MDKDPGIRPIGIGEVPRRIIAKAILRVVRDDVKEAVGPLQTCAGFEAGCEAAVHALNQIWDSEDTEGMLLVDATNAFNTLNRKAALHNIQATCPAISTMLNNTYKAPVRMFVTGGGEISSMEGTTQGDPLAMAMYALAISPLINSLNEKAPNASQVWFADDSNAAGRLEALRDWWQHLADMGPEYGYFPSASKTTMVVKEEFLDRAKELFENTGITITTDGHKMLGAACGKRPFVEGYVADKIKEWDEEIMTLSKIAESYPHTAYTALSRVIIGKWQYLMRTVCDVGEMFQVLENRIANNFIPALTGREPCSNEERSLLSLPTRHGGLNLPNPVDLAKIQHDASLKVTEPLKKMIISQTTSYERLQVHEIKAELRRQKNEYHQQLASDVRKTLSPQKQRIMDLLKEKGSSSWLTALPLKDHGFSLNKGEFRDALCLRYGWQLRNLPQYCICGKGFSTDHAMICTHGGMTIVRQQSAFFDVRVFHPNAPSYRNTSVAALFRKHELDKKREYGERVREVENSSFTPLVFSTTGGASRETTVVYKRLADLLANNRKSSYNTTLAWMRCHISFALMRSAISCIRGSRRQRRHRADMGIDTEVVESNLLSHS